MPARIITEDDARTLREMREWQRKFTGPNSINTPGSAAFGQPPPTRKNRRQLPMAARLPAAQYVGQFYGGVAANTMGMSYIMAVTAV